MCKSSVLSDTKRLPHGGTLCNAKIAMAGIKLGSPKSHYTVLRKQELIGSTDRLVDVLELGRINGLKERRGFDY